MRQRQEVQEVLPPLRGSPAPLPVSAEGERPQIGTLSNLSEPRFPHDANAVAAVAGPSFAREMVIHLGIQDALGERLLQAVEKAVRIKGRLWIGPSQQLVQDGIRNMRRFASRHGWAPFHPSCPPTHEIPDSLRSLGSASLSNPVSWPPISPSYRWLDAPSVHHRGKPS